NGGRDASKSYEYRRLAQNCAQEASACKEGLIQLANKRFRSQSAGVRNDRSCRNGAGVQRPDIIIGFDTEFVRGSGEELCMPGRMNRLLSYQLVVLNRLTGAIHPTIIYPAGPTKKHRYSLKKLLTEALSAARRAGVIEKYPAAVAMADISYALTCAPARTGLLGR
ncbi:MAG: hypothetical protein WB760_00460, partial [Xanthobacteraceae bacterium]